MTGTSHDSAIRLLHREDYQSKDMFDEAAQDLRLAGGTLSVDDSVPDKPYSYSVTLVGHCWSGKHHRVVKGTNLVTLYYTDPAFCKGQRSPAAKIYRCHQCVIPITQE